MLTVTLSPELAAVAGDTAKVFDGTVNVIRFGRALDCEVRLKPGDDRLGRYHFEIRRAAGGYQLVTDRQHPVFLSGERSVGDQALMDGAELRLVDAKSGPAIRLSFSEDAMGLITDPNYKSDSGTVQGSLGAVRKAVAALAAIALLGGGILAWQWHKQSKLEQAFLDEAAALSNKLAAQPGSPRWDDVGRRVSPSVYQVALQRNDGSAPEPKGTAFVVGANVLATNGHVAELFTAQEISNSGIRVVLLSSDPSQAPIPVVAAKVHPAREAFLNLVQNAVSKKGERINTQGGFDVGLFYVDGAAKLAPPLPLASPETVQALRAGLPIAYVGYPAKFATDKTAQKMQFGFIGGITDFLGVAHGKSGELIYHTAPAIWGTSGSPIVNEKGEVIAINSGGEIRDVGDSILVSGSGTYYAQTISLLSDLETGWDEAKSQAAQKEWENATLFLTRRNNISALVQSFKDENSLETPAFENKARLKAGQSRASSGESFVTWQAKAPGTYMAFAVSGENNRLGLWMKAGEAPLQSPIYVDAAPTALFRVGQGESVEFAITGKIDDPYRLQVVKLQD